MDENMNKEIRLTILQHEPTAPQSNSTADSNGWITQMLEKIEKPADNLKRETSEPQSSKEIPKISIPPNAFFKNKQLCLNFTI